MFVKISHPTSRKMVNYFENLIHSNVICEKKTISNSKIVIRTIITIVLGLIALYQNYELFDSDKIWDSLHTIYYIMFLITHFIFAIISTVFNLRIIYLNYDTQKDEESNIITGCLSFVTFLIFTWCLSKFLHIDNQLFEWNENGFLLRQFFSISQSITLLCQIILIKYLIQFRQSKSEEEETKYYKLVVSSDCHIGLISVLDCYLRTAPQLIAKVALILYHEQSILEDINSFKQWCQLFLFFIPLFVMPWSITSFQECLRLQHRNRNIGNTGKVLYFMGHLFIMVSRIGSIGSAFAYYPFVSALVVSTHCILTTIWLLCTVQPMEFYGKKKVWHFAFCWVFGIVYFFNPLHLDTKKTCSKNSWLYIVIGIENILANIVWYNPSNSYVVMYRLSFPFFNIFTFCLGIVFNITYYYHYHPTLTSVNTNFVV